MKVEKASTSEPNELEDLRMDSAIIYGLPKAPATTNQGIFKYDPNTKVATLTNLDQSMTSDWAIIIVY